MSYELCTDDIATFDATITGGKGRAYEAVVNHAKWICRHGGDDGGRCPAFDWCARVNADAEGVIAGRTLEERKGLAWQKACEYCERTMTVHANYARKRFCSGPCRGKSKSARRVAIAKEVARSVRMARADACPDLCGNTEVPYRTEDEADGFRAFYGCEDCGQFWNTGWVS